MENTLAIDSQRRKHFLELNQLVQASGLVTRVESMLQDKIARESPGAIEKHPLWLAFRAAFRVKSRILSGLTKEALADAEILLNEITKGK